MSLKASRHTAISVLAFSAGVLLVAVPAGFAAVNEKAQYADLWKADEELSTEDRERLYTEQFDRHMERRAEFIQRFEATDADLRTLPPRESTGSHVPGPSTLKAALAAANVVIVGRVRELDFSPAGTLAHISVLRVIDSGGDVVQGQELEVALPGGPEPNEGYVTGSAGFDSSVPMLFEGDKAYLFLQKARGRGVGAYYVQSGSGGYLVEANGTIKPAQTNPFAASIQGLSEAEFDQLLREAGAN